LKMSSTRVNNINVGIKLHYLLPKSIRPNF
jgi:hypothetical protein